MLRRTAVNLAIVLSLAALLAAGCSRSGDSKPPADKAIGGTRPVAEIWADVLAERDKIHEAFVKELEAVTHEDCAAVGASAQRLDALYTELVNHLGARSGDDLGRMRQLGDAIRGASAVVQKVRESALAEAPGSWPPLRFPFDRSLRDVERYFTAEELASGSVVNRPGFEAAPPPAARSPI
jgi:hypothetical protein